MGSLALQPVPLRRKDSQPLVTQTLPFSANKVHGQLLVLDSNQLELQPIYTAYGHTCAY
jgi:hypothetical protein